MDGLTGNLTAAGVAFLIVKEIFVTIRTFIANRNGSGEIRRAERLAAVEVKVSQIEKKIPKMIAILSQMRNAFRKKGWIK